MAKIQVKNPVTGATFTIDESEFASTYAPLGWTKVGGSSPAPQPTTNYNQQPTTNYTPPPTTNYNPPPQKEEEQSIPQWYLSNWSANSSGWVEQPVLTINGREYRFNSPQEYISKMDSMGISDGQANSFKQQFRQIANSFKSQPKQEQPSTGGNTSDNKTGNLTFKNGVTVDETGKVIGVGDLTGGQTTAGTGWYDQVTGKETPVGVGTPRPVVDDSATGTTGTTGQKRIYRIGNDIYDADTNQRIPDVATLERDYKGATEVSAPSGTNQTPGGQTGGEVEKLPENLQQKLYQATGRIRPTDEDIENWKYNPNLFEQQLDDMITKNQEEMSAEQKAAEDERIAAEWEKKLKDAPNASYPIDGKMALVKFQSDPTPNDGVDDANTIWLYDSTNQTYRPFASIDAMKAYFGDDYETAMSKLNTLPITALNNEKWASAEFLPRKDAVQNDGTFPDMQETPGSTSIYGNKKQAPDVEENVSNYIGAIFTTMKKKGGITEETFNKYLNDPSVLSKYVSAVLYGGYGFNAVYRDLKAKELADAGDPNYANYKGFDETMSASEWYRTDEGIEALKLDEQITPPETFGMDKSLFTNPLFQIPGAAFSTIIPPIDWDSPEFKEEAEKIQASYYDIMMQKAEANTEQAKAIADNNWNIFKKEMEKNYGINLSNNVNNAWAQLQSLFKGGTRAGIGQSGIMNEAMDRYLADVRESNDRARETKMTTEETQQRNHLLTSGSSEEIANFVAANPELAKEWGLVPSDEVKQWYSKENLKSLYPTMSDEEIDRISGMILDESGNYRSELYQNLYANKYDLGEQKKTYQEQKLYQQKLDEEKKAYAPFTQSNPFSSYQPEYDGDSEAPGSGASTSGMNSWYDQVTGKDTPAGIGTPRETGGYNAPTYGQNSIISNTIGSKPTVSDSYWEKFKTDNAQVDFSKYAPVVGGKEKDYVNIQNPGGSSLYGIKRDLNKEKEGMQKGYYSGDWDSFHKKVYNY